VPSDHLTMHNQIALIHKDITYTYQEVNNLKTKWYLLYISHICGHITITEKNNRIHAAEADSIDIDLLKEIHPTTNKYRLIEL
jgi:hypothetical protein